MKRDSVVESELNNSYKTYFGTEIVQCTAFLEGE